MDTTDPTIAAALLGVVGGLLTILGRAWLADRTRKANAGEKFKNALAPAISELIEGGIPTASILHGSHERHLVAIADYRPFVSFHRRKGFERDASTYSTLAARYLQLGPLALLAAEPPGQEGRLNVGGSLQRLLGYAK